MNETLPIAVAAVGLGLAMTNTIGRPLWRGVASRRWARTRGQIRGTSALPGDPVHVPPDRNLAWAATPVLRYEYTVNGRQYAGTRVNAVGFSGHRAARLAAARYPEEQDVEVWYDPRDPSRAVLEPGVTAGSVFWGVVSVAIVGLAVAALVRAL